jgi:glucokinase
MGKFFMGIDVGGTKIAYGLFDENAKLIAKKSMASDSTCPPEPFFDRIAGEALKLAAENDIPREDLAGVGVGVPSYVKYDEGRIVKTVNLTCLNNFPARDYLSGKLGLPVALANDAQAAALAEHRHGAGRGFANMLYCPVSTGISSAIIIDGKLFRGSYGWAGETGHAIITPGEGILCGCGNRGCLMSYVSGSMIVKHVQAKIAEGEKSILPELAGDASRITAYTIQQGYDLKDQLSLWVVAQMAKYMAVWLYNLYESFNINCFVFGGGLLKFGDRLFPEVRRQFDAYNQSDLPVYFKNAELTEDFGIVGAMELLR